MSLATFAVTAALAFPLRRLKDPQWLFDFLIGLATIVATKPHGRPCWLGLLVAAIFVAGNPLKWPRKNMIAGAASILRDPGHRQLLTGQLVAHEFCVAPDRSRRQNLPGVS